VVVDDEDDEDVDENYLLVLYEKQNVVVAVVVEKDIELEWFVDMVLVDENFLIDDDVLMVRADDK